MILKGEDALLAPKLTEMRSTSILVNKFRQIYLVIELSLLFYFWCYSV